MYQQKYPEAKLNTLKVKSDSGPKYRQVTEAANDWSYEDVTIVDWMGTCPKHWLSQNFY